MLAMDIYSMHVQGGMEYMSPLSFLFVVNLGIAGFLVYAIVKKKTFNLMWLEVFRQIGILILAFGVFGTVVGFLQMFSALETMKETLPLNVISGGVKVALLAIIYGLALFSITQAGYIIMKIVLERQVPTR